MWAFENENVNAIIANVGGNDSIKLLPFIDAALIKDNPKIFIGMPDVMNIHFLCRKAGLSTFYGHNLFAIGEGQCFHPYSQKWFRKSLFETTPLGIIEPNRTCNVLAYKLIQGQGIVQGRLIGGHTGMMELENESIALSTNDWEDSILFLEDIPDFFHPPS